MSYNRGCLPGFLRALVRLGVMARGLVGLVGAGVVPTTAGAQQSATAASALVFDRVTVIDVEQGKLVPNQRVVIVGNRIQAVGDVGVVAMPNSAQVVDARSKYLIPGLWDMHVHPNDETDLFYPLLLANGVTGIRDAGSVVPLDTLLQWRREILAGTRLGPPRQILSGRYISEEGHNSAPKPCIRDSKQRTNSQTCAASDPADVRHLVDSLKVAGADMLKPYVLTREMYFVLAAEARRLSIPFGGHAEAPFDTSTVGVLDASDSGASIIDHAFSAASLDTHCWGKGANVALCQPIADRFRRNGTWFMPTAVVGIGSQPFRKRKRAHTSEFWSGALSHDNWLRDLVGTVTTPVDSLGDMYVLQRTGFPILAGTDEGAPWRPKQSMPAFAPGFSLHAELATYAANGLTPLNALQTATLNPAKMLHGTDSLGTVAAGKLADLVLLDADPLADITNTTTIHAVVANGRYLDRAALDHLLAEVRAKAGRQP